MNGMPVEILGLPDHATYRDHWPLLHSTADAWDRLKSGDAALVSEQLARRLKLDLGDQVQVPSVRSRRALADAESTEEIEEEEMKSSRARRAGGETESTEEEVSSGR